MRIYRGLSALPADRAPTALTIGNFDGVHRGHLACIERLVDLGAKTASTPTILTFDPHPQKVLRGEAPVALSTFEKKAELLAEAGVEQLVVLEFDSRLAHTEAEEFIERVLVEGLRVRVLTVGSDFGFGRFRRGDVAMLRTFGKRHGYEVKTLRLARLKGRLLSSTEVRHALQAGDLQWATEALGRPYRLPGKVVRGKGRGKKLGYPTANLEVPENMCIPALGYYAGRLVESGREHPAAVSVGSNPTFGKNPITIEAFVLDFDGDLYGAEVEIEFLRFLREEQAFADEESLVAAIASDVEQVRRYFARR